MALGDLSDRQAVIDAIVEYDELGQEAFLEKYQFGQATGYFLEWNGKQYDSKALVGAAHGIQHGRPLRAVDFSGGNATVARRLEALGFKVVRPMSSPDWCRDELILALDVYLRDWQHVSFGPGSDVVIDLSDLLRSLTIFTPEVRAVPRFRNPAGVALKMHNFAAINPRHPGAGMGHGAVGDVHVWNEWADRPSELHAVAVAIRSASSSEAVLEPTDEVEEYEALEGRLLYRKHRRYERDVGLVRRKRREVRNRTGRLACEVCEFDSEAEYGVPGIVDVHHMVPLHKLGETATRLSDLAVLCPTCHRIVHAHRPFLTPDELRRKRKHE